MSGLNLERIDRAVAKATGACRGLCERLVGERSQPAWRQRGQGTISGTWRCSYRKGRYSVFARVSQLRSSGWFDGARRLHF
jgi:hypothetical protein